MATLSTLDVNRLLPATFTAPGLSETEFLKLCDQFPDAMVEYTSDGTVIVMPPTDPESGARTGEVFGQLRDWNRQGSSGQVTGPDAGFHFRDGSRRAPDAAWFDDARWREAKASSRKGQSFPIFAPDFVIEVRSPDDRIAKLREKMDEYIANGVKLAWLIDPQERSVAIYRPGRDVETLHDPIAVKGDGPIAGFVLDLRLIFR